MAKAKQSASRRRTAGPARAGSSKAGSSKASPAKVSQSKNSPAKASAAKASPARASVAEASAPTAGSAQASPAQASPARAATAAARRWILQWRHRPPDPAPPPWPVGTAAKLMYAGAVLSALDLVVTLATLGTSRSLLRAAQPHVTVATLNADMDSLLAGSVGIWLVSIAVWVVMGKTNAAGRGWARIIGTLLCVASTVSFLAFLGEPTSVLTKIILIPLWLAGFGAVVLLWLPKSTAYIRAETALARERLAGDRLARDSARSS